MSEKFLTIQDASKRVGVPVRTLYRLARDLKVIEKIYGRIVLPSECLPALKAGKRSIGNPNWKKGSRAASRDGKKGGINARESHLKAPSRRVAQGSH